MGIFGKTEIKSLAAIKDVAPGDITAEQISAINTEFAELGFNGIEVAAAGTLKAAEDKAAADLKTAGETHAEELKKATDEVASLKTKLAALPAGKTEEPKAEKDAIKNIESSEVDLDKQLSDKIRAERRI